MFEAGIMKPVRGGDPTIRSQVAPFLVPPEELMGLAFNDHRKALLRRFIQYRADLRAQGIEAIQWVDGSFAEEKELPGDIDVVSWSTASLPAQFVVPVAKATYGLDAYAVFLGAPPASLVSAAAYWRQLFGHQRKTGRHKGFFAVLLTGDANEDQALIGRLGP